MGQHITPYKPLLLFSKAKRNFNFLNSTKKRTKGLCLTTTKQTGFPGRKAQHFFKRKEKINSYLSILLCLSVFRFLEVSNCWVAAMCKTPTAAIAYTHTHTHIYICVCNIPILHLINELISPSYLEITGVLSYLMAKARLPMISSFMITVNCL